MGVVCRDLTAALQNMLQVEDVWFLSQGCQASQEFVLWAGRVLEHRSEDSQVALGFYAS